MDGLFQKLEKAGQVLVHEPPPAALPNAKKTKGANGETVKAGGEPMDDEDDEIRSRRTTTSSLKMVRGLLALLLCALLLCLALLLPALR